LGLLVLGSFEGLSLGVGMAGILRIPLLSMVAQQQVLTQV
jgi:hypothetical protein